MLDLLFTNARICDGSGSPSHHGAVGVQDGRITFVGGSGDGQVARRTIDVQGEVLAPGFIDPHTHYDAQVCWDDTLTSSPWHGVTTICMGNCGVGVAPARPAAREALLRDLENVEAIPYEVMSTGIPWGWESYGEYLDFIDRKGTSINLVGLVSLTALRYYVMGEAAMERAASTDEVGKLQDELRRAMQDGAWGFSGDFLPHHVGYKGRPLACSLASREEIRGLCEVLRELDRGTASISLASTRLGTLPLSDADVELLRMMVTVSGRRMTWLPLLSKFGEPDFPRHTLAKLGELVAHAVPQITPRPMVFLVSLGKPFRFGWYDTWKKAIGATRDEQEALYRSPTWRTAALEEMRTHDRQFPWANFWVKHTRSPALAHYEGRTIAAIAAAEGKSPLETFLDIGLADDMNGIFELQNANLDPAGVEWLVKNPDLLIGVSDAGAHVDQLCDVVYSTYVLQHWVRETGVLSLEEGVRRLTSMPAHVFGIAARGRLVPGYHADLVIFDPATVGPEPPEMRADLPLGAERLIAKAHGITASFVGGVQVLDRGELLAARPGRTLRSGRDG